MSEAGDGRRVRSIRKVRLADVTPRARLRLDAMARYFQDVAGDDIAATHLPEHHGWVLRRLAATIDHFPILGDDIEVITRCTGVGGRWAERTTTIGVPGDRVAVTSRAVWVWVSLETMAPRPLPPAFFEVYGDGVRDHRVSARLTLPAPDPAAPRVAWPLRGTDIDIYEHVTNANYWLAVEDWLAGPGAGRRIRDVTIEFGSGLVLSEECAIAIDAAADATSFHFLVGDDVRAAARVGFAGDE